MNIPQPMPIMILTEFIKKNKLSTASEEESQSSGNEDNPTDLETVTE